MWGTGLDKAIWKSWQKGSEILRNIGCEKVGKKLGKFEKTGKKSGEGWEKTEIKLWKINNGETFRKKWEKVESKVGKSWAECRKSYEKLVEN